MSRVLILYGTTEGQTAFISEYIAEVVRDHGHETETLDVKELPGSFTFDRYEAVIVGASIHMGEHEEYVRDFAKRNHEALERMPSAFFSVSLTAREDTDEAWA
jgi:menaquinone-dependent protoporphyrinogen oxidase